jgi:hypothetical protein
LAAVPPVEVHDVSTSPQLIGKAVSHDCIRVSNATVLRLKQLVVAGTPVKITLWRRGGTSSGNGFSRIPGDALGT